MKKVLAIALAAAGFAGGYFWRGRSAKPAAPQERKVLYWYDPMHPAYTSDKPGVAPDCGMRLVPRYEGGAAAQPAGTISIPAGKRQLIGVETGVAEMSSAGRTIRAEGVVALDETRITRVHSRTEGWIDKVMVDYTGQFVRKGQPLLTVYSPDLLATQEEYLLALEAKQRLAGSPVAGSAAQIDRMIEAARRRLELWNFTPEQIGGIASARKPVRSVTLHSPAAGYVTMRNAFPDQQIKPETELYTLADLSRVWVMADVFEEEAPLVRIGTPARLTLASQPGRTLEARVVYIQPQVDPATRTIKIRLEMNNPHLSLKPDMYVGVELRTAAARRVEVPEGAVLDSGDRQTVFIDRGEGYFEPRSVKTGERMDGRIAILEGLKPGERIAVSGAFLLDSESKLKPPEGGAKSGGSMPGMPGMPNTPKPEGAPRRD